MTREELLETGKPILFNTEMVQAILDNRKTVTRRVIKFPEGTTGRLPESGATDYIYYPGGIKRPPYQVGDIFYVRETFRYVSIGEECSYTGEGIWDDEVVQYKASQDEFNKEYEDLIGEYHEWKPSIHMPKSIARIFLKVTDVRVERLQDITEEQAEKEGFISTAKIIDDGSDYTGLYADEHFINTWDSIYAMKGCGLYANPWVFVIEFERLEVEE